MSVRRRTTCLRCEQEGRTTQLVQTARGGVCPVHEPRFIESLKRSARVVLGLPPNGPELAHVGIPGSSRGKE